MCKVLIACEFSGVVRDAFIARGFDAVSCDLQPSETPGPHHVGDALEIVGDGWDLMIAHPPCTYLARSGARWWDRRADEQADSLAFVRALLAAPVPRIAVENPVGLLNRVIGPASQIIQPWQYGHGETKATCLWLAGLPRLQPTRRVAGRVARVHRMPPSPNRGRERSRTYVGIAEAMADQWGAVLRGEGGGGLW